MSGWIKLHRSITQSWVWSDKPYTKGQAWIDMLMMVNHTDTKTLIGNEIVNVERGQKIWSILEMSKRWGWSRKKVSNFLNRLETDSMLAQNRTSKYTMITVVNYDLYQDEEHQKNIKRTSKEHQKNTNKNDKNVKNNIYIYIRCQHLTMTKKEYDTLVEKFGKTIVDEKIEYAENYAKLKNYKSLYLTLNNWLKKDAEKEADNGTAKQRDGKNKKDWDVDPSFFA